MKVAALGLILIWTVPSYGETFLPASHPKVKTTQLIYDRLVGTIGDSRTPPDFRMVAGKASHFDVALYSSSRRAIYLEEEFYDLVQTTLASSSSQALGLILGHELAHFYRNHVWAEDFNRSFTQRQIIRPDQGTGEAGSLPVETAIERRRLETEADYFAGFYGYLAGLSTVTIAAQLFDSVYAHYHYDSALPAYEHLRQRKETAREAQYKLRALIPLFEAGVQSLLIRDYDSAGRIFNRVASDFPSPEVLSNAAVADTLAALQWEHQTDARYIYPVEIDPDTRLSGETKRGPMDLPQEEQAERRRTFLERAKRTLEKVTRLQFSYVPAHVNLACVLDLLGEYELATIEATTAMSLSQTQQLPASVAHARTITGIVLAHQGHHEQSIQEFQRAAEMGDRTAVLNLAPERASDRGEATIDAVAPYLPDRVGAINIADISEKDFLRAADPRTLGRWDEGADESPALVVQMMEKGVTRVVALVRGTGSMRSVVFIASTAREAVGETVRGIRAGQTAEAVEHAYGPPGSSVTLPRGRYTVYQRRTRDPTGIIFRYDDAQVVQEWVVYRIDHN